MEATGIISSRLATMPNLHIDYVSQTVSVASEKGVKVPGVPWKVHLRCVWTFMLIYPGLFLRTGPLLQLEKLFKNCQHAVL